MGREVQIVTVTPRSKRVKVKDREAEVRELLKHMGFNRKEDLTIMLDASRKHGFHESIIYVNPNLPDDLFWWTLAHELLHWLGLCHCEQSRQIGFSSTSFKKDVLSKVFAMAMKFDLETSQPKRTR